MSDIELRRQRLPAWRTSADGKKKHLPGRWSLTRVTEVLIAAPNRKFTMDDLARLVYGSTSKHNRNNARKHVPTQRNYMMSRLTPFVTFYGPRGMIDYIKLYDHEQEEDRVLMEAELGRLHARCEISHERYVQLSRVLHLRPPE